MTRLRVHCFATSIDGYGAGPHQRLENPLGVGGLALYEWSHSTRTFQSMMRKEGGNTGVDDDFVARGIADIGAWIIGRNMFGPVRGPWPDSSWKGWWGAPVLLGSGEALFSSVDLPGLGYRCIEHVATPHATHFVLGRSAA